MADTLWKRSSSSQLTSTPTHKVGFSQVYPKMLNNCNTHTHTQKAELHLHSNRGEDARVPVPGPKGDTATAGSLESQALDNPSSGGLE